MGMRILFLIVVPPKNQFVVEAFLLRRRPCSQDAEATTWVGGQKVQNSFYRFFMFLFTVFGQQRWMFRGVELHEPSTRGEGLGVWHNLYVQMFSFS